MVQNTVCFVFLQRFSHTMEVIKHILLHSMFWISNHIRIKIENGFDLLLLLSDAPLVVFVRIPPLPKQQVPLLTENRTTSYYISGKKKKCGT